MRLENLLAAYLAEYDGKTVEEFEGMRECLHKFQLDNLIRGVVSVHAEEEDLQEIMNKMVDTICEHYGHGSTAELRISIKVLLFSFMKSIRDDSDRAAWFDVN